MHGLLFKLKGPQDVGTSGSSEFFIGISFQKFDSYNLSKGYSYQYVKNVTHNKHTTLLIFKTGGPGSGRKLKQENQTRTWHLDFELQATPSIPQINNIDPIECSQLAFAKRKQFFLFFSICEIRRPKSGEKVAWCAVIARHRCGSNV